MNEVVASQYRVSHDKYPLGAFDKGVLDGWKLFPSTTYSLLNFKYEGASGDVYENKGREKKASVVRRNHQSPITNGPIAQWPDLYRVIE